MRIGPAASMVALVFAIVGLLGLAAMGAHDASSGDACTRNFLKMQPYVAGGGPPKDGIPALDNPKYVSAQETKLAPEAIVFGVNYKGWVTALPQSIMVWHEVVNQEVGGQKLSVTYCPLTGSVIGYLGRNLGVSGKLYNSNLILYDRADDSWFPQIMGKAVQGPQCGVSLDTFPVKVTTWGQWRKAHPQTTVLSHETGYSRDYTRDPYLDYYQSNKVWFPMTANSNQLAAKERVLGIEHQGQAVAVLKDGFAKRHPQGLEVTLAGRKFKLDWDPVLGAIVVNQPVKHFEVFWFAWYAHHPKTKLIR